MVMDAIWWISIVVTVEITLGTFSLEMTNGNDKHNDTLHVQCICICLPYTEVDNADQFIVNNYPMTKRNSIKGRYFTETFTSIYVRSVLNQFKDIYA